MAGSGTIHMSGNPDCEKCHGRGVVPNGTFAVTPCECTVLRSLVRNVDRGWKGLMTAPNLDGRSPLLDAANSNSDCWITADRPTIRTHLKHTALRMGPNWKFNVVTDAELITAWLATAGLAGMKVLDPDVMLDAAPVSLRKLTLIDMVEPSDNLVVILGVKAARNVAMPEVLLEAITLRRAAGKPMWLVDQPNKPFREGHRAWSYEVQDEMYGYEKYALQSTSSGGEMPRLKDMLETDTAKGRRSSRRSLSSGSGQTRTLKGGSE